MQMQPFIIIYLCNLIGYIGRSHADGIVRVHPVLKELFEERSLPVLRKDLNLRRDSLDR